MTINELAKECYQISVNHGFWRGRDVNDILSSLAEMALIHSEVSEAVEALRNKDDENFVEELVDICIRVFDSAEARGIDLEDAILKKMAINRCRTFMHGKEA